jgi:hypothetical protein
MWSRNLAAFYAVPMPRWLLLSWTVLLGMVLPADLAAQPAVPNRLPGQPLNQPVSGPVSGQPWTQHPYYTPPPPPPPQTLWFPMFFPLLLAPLLLVAVVMRQQRVQQEQNAEEEDKTRYTEDDLMQDWEFKIVRCSRPAFSRRPFLDKVLTEEAVAGWQLVELLDGQRIRLKRPISSRAGDATLPESCNPYRLEVVDPISKAKEWQIGWWFLFGCSGGVALCGLLFAVFSGPEPISITVAGVGAALMLLFGFLARRCSSLIKRLA